MHAENTVCVWSHIIPYSKPFCLLSAFSGLSLPCCGSPAPSVPHHNCPLPYQERPQSSSSILADGFFWVRIFGKGCCVCFEVLIWVFGMYSQILVGDRTVALPVPLEMAGAGCDRSWAGHACPRGHCTAASLQPLLRLLTPGWHPQGAGDHKPPSLLAVGWGEGGQNPTQHRDALLLCWKGHLSLPSSMAWGDGMWLESTGFSAWGAGCKQEQQSLTAAHLFNWYSLGSPSLWGEAPALMPLTHWEGLAAPVPALSSTLSNPGRLLGGQNGWSGCTPAFGKCPCFRKVKILSSIWENCLRKGKGGGTW